MFVLCPSTAIIEWNHDHGCIPQHKYRKWLPVVSVMGTMATCRLKRGPRFFCLGSEAPGRASAGSQTPARSRARRPGGLGSPLLCATRAAHWNRWPRGLWDQEVYRHFWDTRESPPLKGGLVFWKPFVVSQKWSFPLKDQVAPSQLVP